MSMEFDAAITRRDLLKGGLLLSGAILLDGCGVQFGDTTTQTITTGEYRVRPLTQEEIRFEEAVSGEIEQEGFEHAYSTNHGPFDIRVFGDGNRMSPANVKDTIKTVSGLWFGSPKSNSSDFRRYVKAFDTTNRKIQIQTLGPQVINLILEPNSDTCVEANPKQTGNLFVRKKLEKGGCLGNPDGLGLPDYGFSDNFGGDGFRNIVLIVVRFTDGSQHPNVYDVNTKLSSQEQTLSTFAHELGHTFIRLSLDHPDQKWTPEEEEVVDLIEQSATKRLIQSSATK